MVLKLFYTNSKGGFVSFNNNSINTTANWGIVLNAQKLSSIGTNNTFTNIKGILVEGDFNSSTPQTWKNLNVPYMVNHELDIDGNLTIEQGTTFRFDANGWLAIGYYSSTTFIADGGSAATPNNIHIKCYVSYGRSLEMHCLLWFNSEQFKNEFLYC